MKQHIYIFIHCIFTIVSLCSDLTTAPEFLSPSSFPSLFCAAEIGTYFTIQYVIRGEYSCDFYVHVLVQTFVGISPFHTTDHAYPLPPVQAGASCSSASFSDEY